MHADPIWQTLPQLHMWFAGKTARPRQVALHSGLHRRGARTRSCPYGRTPLVVGWGNPRTLEARGRHRHRKRAH